jgi:hypothetical protein
MRKPEKENRENKRSKERIWRNVFEENVKFGKPPSIV